MIKKIFLLFCLMLLLPVSVYASFKGLHPPMEIEPELLAPSLIEGMVFIKGGCFEMGDTFGDTFGDIFEDIFEDERPVHTVCLDEYYIGKYEVTQKEWVSVMGSNPSYFKDCDNCPVEMVNWDDVQIFIERLNSKSGRKFRLPTEAEWEYAAKSGGKKEKFAGFSNESQLYLYANVCDSNCELSLNAMDPSDVFTKKNISPVGSFRPNGLGLYDMTGNVLEWVSDWYGEGYYSSGPKNNPTGPLYGQFRLLRGGSCFNTTWFNRASFRYRFIIPTFRGQQIGFRLALSPK